jgi:hypothetical protein
MVSSAITPTRTIAILIGVAVIAVAGFAVVRSGVFEPDTVQGAIPGPGSSSPSVSRSPSVSPSPTPTAAPEPTTPAQIKAKNIADAKARLVEYYETTASVANNGYQDWESKLLPFWVRPDMRSSMTRVFSAYKDEGKYTTGAASVETMSVSTYKADDSNFELVGLEACIDFTQVKNFSVDGDPIPRAEGAPSRYLFGYKMQHQGPDSIWTISSEVPHPERAC